MPPDYRAPPAPSSNDRGRARAAAIWLAVDGQDHREPMKKDVTWNFRYEGADLIADDETRSVDY